MSDLDAQESRQKHANEASGLAQQSNGAVPSASPEFEPAAVETGDARPQDPKSADDVLGERMPGHEAADAAVLEQSRRHTRRTFVGAAAAAAASYGFYHWLEHGPQDDMQPTLLRRSLQANALLSRDVFREHALAPTYPMSRAETLRVNGLVGLKKNLVPESWRLQLVGVRNAQQNPRYVEDVTAWEYQYTAADSKEDKGHDTKTEPKAGTKTDPKTDTKTDPKTDTAGKMAPAPAMGKVAEDENHTGRKARGLGEAGESYSTLKPGTPGLLLTMNDLLQLPRHEFVTQFKCIEGWSQVVHWAGVRMADFLELYPPAPVDGKEPKFVYMETPDGDYFNGYDMLVCRHPQTLLVTEMMGKPLTQVHGAPLRLHMPTKYGYKQIKRIGLISYGTEKPDDYWTELGYDWYAGL